VLPLSEVDAPDTGVPHPENMAPTDLEWNTSGPSAPEVEEHPPSAPVPEVSLPSAPVPQDLPVSASVLEAPPLAGQGGDAQEVSAADAPGAHSVAEITGARLDVPASVVLAAEVVVPPGI